jgi:hypothetical protein
MSAESLLDLQKRRQPVEKALVGLRSDSRGESAEAGKRLLHDAARYGVSLRDYLNLAIDTRGTQLSDLSGYEAALVYLNLPVREDFKEGIVLQAASETFQTYPGTRAMFPPVIDDMLQWAKRQDQIEQLDPMLALTRTINGPELLFTIVNDDGSEYQSFSISELGRIPVRSIRTSEQSVRFYKHGSGIRTSYEFNRRARLDLLTPFAARVQREMTLSKVRAAVSVLVNGDGTANSAAGTIAQSSYNTKVGTNSTNGIISYQHLLAWLVARAQAGAPVDTVIGNWDALFQWIKMFQPAFNSTVSQADALRQMAGVMPTVIPLPMPQAVNFVIASSAPANKLIGLVRGETLEQLIEAGSDIQEEERAILNQSITYVRTENSGFRLVFKDTRSIFNFGG